MFPERDKDKLEGLNEALNSRTRYHDPSDVREPIGEASETAPEHWESTPIDELLASERRAPEPYPLVRKIFFVAALFCACAAIAAALIYFKGDNFISTKNLDITVEGPISVSAGSPVELQITIKNNNNAALDSVNFNIIYPDGTRSAENPTEELTHRKETLEGIGAGDRITKIERAVFLGAEGDVKEIRITVDYKVAGSNAVFTKEKEFELTIGSAPVSVTIAHPESVVSGTPFTATINIAANSEEQLKNIVVRAEYPYGWSFVSANPSPLANDKNIWRLGDLSPGDKKTITLNGTLTGEDNEERTFRFFVGAGKGETNEFDTALSSDSIVVAINRPSVDIDVTLNGDSSLEYAAPAGQRIQAVVSYRNNLPTNLLNPQITVTLNGSALNRSSVQNSSGFYNSAQSFVFWNQSNDANFVTLAPGTSGSVSLSFASMPTLQAGSVNQKIDLTIVLMGQNQDDRSQVKVTEKRTVKIASQTSLNTVSLYSRGPFPNTGAVPPKAEKETTYTIAWTLGNTQNDVVDSKIVGTLGPNVKWLKSSDPAITYDDTTRTVTWNVGTLSSGTGFSSAQREGYFQVSLTPSLGQVGGAPVLVSGITFTGTDSFTHSAVRLTNPSVTTRTSTDPSYVQGDEIVVK